jgi:hypothetical protein
MFFKHHLVHIHSTFHQKYIRSPRSIMSSPTKAKKAPAKEKDASEIAGLTQNEIKYLLLANLCMPDSGKVSSISSLFLRSI